MSTKPVFSLKAFQDNVEVYEDRINITPRGLDGFLSKGLKGTKTIPFSSITAIQLKKPGFLTAGYLQFSLLGGIESSGGIMDAVKDENTIMLGRDKKTNKEAEKIKEYIENQIKESKKSVFTQASSVSLADELEKLAKLKDNGIITEEDFQTAKKRLIG